MTASPDGDLPRRDFGAPLRRVVVKLGSSLVVSEHFPRLVSELVTLRATGVEVAVVTSGAVAAGMAVMALDERPAALSQVQALAALGQGELMGRYGKEFGRAGIRCAQLLLTHEDLSSRRHFMNISHTLEATFSLGLVPVVNENDTVATEELRFGDNDRLAAALAIVVEADLVVLLSDIDALYDADPRLHPTASAIHEVTHIDDAVREVAGAAGSTVGTGGMASKVAAAELATRAGIPLVIAAGEQPGLLGRVHAGEVVGTCFHPVGSRVGRRRHWIGFLSKVLGTLQIDAGAVTALRERGSSLLPVGVRGVEGHFCRGDAVRVVGPDGVEVARGLVGYDADDVRRIAGRSTAEVPQILENTAADPVIHRNDLNLVDADPR